MLRPQPLLPLLRPAALLVPFMFVQAPIDCCRSLGASLLVFWLFHVGVPRCMLPHQSSGLSAPSTIVKVPNSVGAVDSRADKFDGHHRIPIKDCYSIPATAMCL